jgi:hypothetical protein
MAGMRHPDLVYRVSRSKTLWVKPDRGAIRPTAVIGIGAYFGGRDFPAKP